MHKNRFGILALLTVFAALTGGCNSMRNVYAGVYDVFRFRQQQETLPGERSALQVEMTYSQYEAERERLLKKDKNP